MAARGRKKKTLDIERVEHLASLGLSEEQIARQLNVNWKTLAREKKEKPEFMEALKRGQDKGIREVTNALYQNAIGGNIAAQIFFLKNRDPDNWSDKHKVDADIKGQVIIKHFENEKDL